MKVIDKKMLGGKILYLANEANNWEDGSPVGAGNIAAMLYGHVASERIQLNEEFIWSGGPIPNPKRVRECIDHMLEMIKGARYQKQINGQEIIWTTASTE